jgi:hemin uptake protein HemP
MQTFTSTEPAPAFLPSAEDGSPLTALASSADMPARKRVSSEALLGNQREIEIQHGAQLYRLRLTALGKLILTK